MIFFLSLQDFIINNCNNQDFWINLSQDKIEKFVVYMEKEYQYSKNILKIIVVKLKKYSFKVLKKKIMTKIKNANLLPQLLKMKIGIKTARKND